MKPLRAFAWLLLSAGLLAGVSLGIERLGHGFPLALADDAPLGSAGIAPSMAQLEWLSLWMFFGTLAVAACARGLWLLLADDGRAERWQRIWHAGSDAAWIAGASLLALGLAWSVRESVLHSVDLGADESAFRRPPRAARVGRRATPGRGRCGPETPATSCTGMSEPASRASGRSPS